MRNEEYEKNLLVLRAEVGQRQQKIASPTREQIAICCLVSKCLSHCEMSIQLIRADALGEAIIILRAAYEAVIRALYLDENPDKLPAYEAFSAITTLRNQLEVLKLLDEFGEPYEGKEEQQGLIEHQKQKIIAAGYHLLYKLDPKDLDNWNAVKKVTNKSNLPSFEDVRMTIQKTEQVKALLTFGFQIYNIGSQLAHSSLEMSSAMVYFEMKHPLYTEHSAYRQALLLMLCCCQCLVSCGVLRVQDLEDLRVKYKRIAEQFVVPSATSN